MGNDPPKEYSASFDGSTEGFKYTGCDEELFFALSDTALKRYGNCAVYQAELMGILGAFDRGEHLPEFPIELGTSPFGSEFRPGFLRIMRNKLWRVLFKLGIVRPRAWVHPEYRNDEPR